MISNTVFGTLLLAALAHNGNFEGDNREYKQREVLFNYATSLRGSKSNDRDEKDITSSLAGKGFRGLRFLKHNYLLLKPHGDQLSRP